MNLMEASIQWMSRPADERFENISDMLASANRQADNSEEGEVLWRQLHIDVLHDGLVISGPNRSAAFSNFAFRQMMNRLDYPIDAFVDRQGNPRIPLEMAADILNHRISETSDDQVIKMFAEKTEDGNALIRSVTSDSYGRVLDRDILPYVNILLENGWRVPPARPAFGDQPGTRLATEEDVLDLNEMNQTSLSIRVGDPIAPAGLYRGDRDMFVVLCNTQNAVDDGSGLGLMEGMFIKNSEVGASSFRITKFKMQTICGNHIVWGAEDVFEYKYRHVGNNVFEKCISAIREIVDSEPTDLSNYAEIMTWMRNTELGRNKEETVSNVYKILMKDLPKSLIESGYDTCVENESEDGNPNSFMGIVNGITRYSQTIKNQDTRLSIDTKIGKLFDYAKGIMNNA